MKPIRLWLFVVAFIAIGVGVYLVVADLSRQDVSPDSGRSTRSTGRAPRRGMEEERSRAGEQVGERRAEHVVTGVVISADANEPVADATVIFYWEGAAARTGSDGRYKIAGIPPGEVEVIAYAEGMATPSLVRHTVHADRDTELNITVEPTASITGFVVDKHTGRPIGSATIHVDIAPTLPQDFERMMFRGLPREDENAWSLSTDKPFALTSDERGAFTIPFVLAEMEMLSVQASGYIPAELILRGTDPTVPLIVELERGLTITGRVLSPDGQPVEDASVHLVSAGLPGAFGTSDPQGRFSLGELGEGTYSLYVSHDEYPGVEYGEVEVERDRPLDEIEIRFLKAAFISGRVTDNEGVPIRARVSIQYLDGEVGTVVGGQTWSGPIHVSFGSGAGPTDEDGSYTTTPLLPGRYEISAAEPSHYDAEPQVVELAEGERRLGVDFSLKKKEGVLAGRIVDPDGRPVAGAQLRLDVAGSLYVYVSTKEDGTFIHEGVAPGRIKVKVEAQGYPGKEIKVAAPARDIVIELDRGGTIAGRVVNRLTGEPIEKFTLDLVSVSLDHLPVHDLNGRFKIPAISRGTHWLRVTADGYAPVEIEDIWVEDDAETEEIVVELVESATVVFRVTASADGSPVAGAEVSSGVLFSQGDSRTGADGSCRVGGVGPGEHAFAIRHEQFCNDSVIVKLGEGEKHKVVRVALREAPTVRGRVTAKGDGSPIPGARLVLRWDYEREEPPSPTQIMSQTKTDGEGAFAFSHVNPGAYELAVEGGGYAAVKKEVTVRAQSDEQVLVELSAGGRIIGMVVTPDGQPVQGIMLVAGHEEARTDARGEYVFPHISPGAHEVGPWSYQDAGPDRRAWERKEVTVSDGEEVHVDFTIGGGAALYGAVTSGGEPLDDVELLIEARAISAVIMKTDARGRYRVEDLPSGKYKMRIRLEQEGNRGHYATDYRWVEIAEHDREFNVELGAGRISGVVRRGDGKPVYKALLKLSPEISQLDRVSAMMSVSTGHYEAHRWTDGNGLFAFSPLAPGAYSLFVKAPGHAPQLLQVNVKEDDSDRKLAITLSKEATVTARLRVPDGKMPPYAYIAVCDDEGRELGRDRAEVNPETGECQIYGLGSGHCFIAVKVPGCAPLYKELSISAAQEAVLDLDFKQGRRLDVAVVDTAGSPVEGARVVLDPGGDVAFARLLNRHTFVRLSEAEVEGALPETSLYDLPDGNYTIHVRCEGYEEATAKVRISGTDEQVTVTLKPGTTDLD